MLRLRSWVSLFFLFLLVGAVPAAAQSVASIVDDMRAQYEKQLETVNTYIVETNLYTSYNKKVMQEGEPTYKTQTRMTGEGAPAFASTTTPSTAYGLQFERLKKHATYAGTETIDGARCHVLQIDAPSKVDPEMGAEAESMTYYVHADQLVPARMVMRTRASKGNGPKAGTVTVNLKNYVTTEGLTLPHRMEIQFEMDMSDEQRKQMQKMMKQMEDMPEQQRKMMERMMGDKMDMMRKMMSEEPVVIEVQNVQVNTPIPDGIF